MLRTRPDALREMAARLPEVERPVVLQGALAELPDLLALRGEADVRFDAIVGRSALNPGRLGSPRRHGEHGEPIRNPSVLSVPPW